MFNAINPWHKCFNYVLLAEDGINSYNLIYLIYLTYATIIKILKIERTQFMGAVFYDRSDCHKLIIDVQTGHNLR